VEEWEFAGQARQRGPAGAIFFPHLGDDVQIDQSHGDWLGFDFDHESLNFTRNSWAL